MTSEWRELATSGRWRGVVSFIGNWLVPLKAEDGMAGPELDAILAAKSLYLPPAVREWYVLAANWETPSVAVWSSPDELEVDDDVTWILTDTEGITRHGIRSADLALDDPPVISREQNHAIVCETFSTFVGVMTANDVIFDYRTEEPIELAHDAVSFDSMRLIWPNFSCGDLFADGPLELASVLVFRYPNKGPIYAKARTSAVKSLLQGMRLTSN
ncbi:MAG TPA: hypothetical protein VFE62_00095 [Gemmataceae bacterium]|nr:hypothetical protein [Gemmataceae bacterium]